MAIHTETSSTFLKKMEHEYLTRLQQRPLIDLSKKQSLGWKLSSYQARSPLQWRVGRITEVFPDKDNYVRVVSFKTTDGTLKRLISKLYKLSLDQN